MELMFVCPKCRSKEVVEYTPGVFDQVFYDEPRFPGSTVYMCPECGDVTKVSSGMIVRVNHPRCSVPVKVKTDEYEMNFSILSLEGKWGTYNIDRLEEVVGRFATDGSIPD